ncbi:MAG TPA: peptide chain release factor N(5)-glutamine methyltransferase [Candidatus Tumulicola sp.]|nr:peptide chain release factor N(5)-glutamine methyltransferase [Candidatus Tumulicola sp.]
MPSLDAVTIAGAMEACRRRLLGVSDTPALDARVLASHVIGLDASALIAYGDSRLDGRRRDALMALAERRARGEPIAYIVGSKEFCGLKIAVNRKALVPRPETEELVMAVVADWPGRSAEIVDVGTGSGAVACALAYHLSDARVTATDSSADALDVARQNVDQLGLEDRVSLVLGDLFDAVAPDQRFDAIVANLPYVREADPELHEDVRAFEPHQALFAGADGLDVYRRLFAAAPRHLAPGGRVYCECGPSTADGLLKIARRAFPAAQVELRPDASGRARMVIAGT